MSFRVKCDGEIFSTTGGYLRTILSNMENYNMKGKINYETLKNDIKKDKLDEIPQSPLLDGCYIDFDLMEEEKSNKPFAIGYDSCDLGRVCEFVIIRKGILDMEVSDNRKRQSKSPKKKS